MTDGDEEGGAPGDVLAALGAQYSPAILAAAAEPISAQELSDQLEIPLATCYRRIDELTAAGLLELEGEARSAHGGRTNVYRRSVDRLQVEFGQREVSIDTVERRPVKNKLDEVWRSTTQR